MSLVPFRDGSRGSTRGSKEGLAPGSGEARGRPESPLVAALGDLYCGPSRGRKTVVSGLYPCRRWPRARYFALPLLPPCFPGFRAGIGEAKNGPEGPFEAIDFL